MIQLALGIDIGGTNTVFGLVDRHGKCYEKAIIPTPGFPTPEQLAEAIKNQVDVMLSNISDAKITGIGIGAPNGNYYNGTIEYAPNLAWTGIINLVDIFNNLFECPVYVTNDANAAAIGEMIYGKTQNILDFIIVTLGTGLGSGFVSNGQLVYGHDGFAGELGHVIVEPEGRLCGCRRQGCLETYASATGLVRTAEDMITRFTGNTLLKPGEITAKSVGEAAAKHDALALNIFDYTAKKLGLGLANAVAITSPKMIVLYGGVANAGDILLKPLNRYFESYLLEIYKNKVEIALSELDNNNGAIIGASALVWNELTQ